MGCGGSKLEDLPAVVLCKKRCFFMEEAVRLRLLLADSHLSYIHSLRTIGNFFHFLLLEAPNSSAPVLTLPPERKGDPQPPTGKHVTFHSHSNSGSHLHLPSDSDADSDSDLSNLHLHDNEESLPPHAHQHSNPTFFHMNYMKSAKPTASIVYEQKPFSSESVFYFGDESVANTYSESYTHSYPGYSSYPGEASGGNYGYAEAMPHAGIASSSSTKPPPSPPRASPWDFFNVFDSANSRYYGAYGAYGSKSTPRSSNAREEDGLPDLEDADEATHNHRDRKNGHFVRNEMAKEPQEVSHSSGVSSLVGDEEETHSSSNDHIASDASTDEDIGEGEHPEVPVEYEVRVMDKKVVGSSSHEETRNPRRRGPLIVSQVVSEIKSQFEKASVSADDVLHLLEPFSYSHGSRSLVVKKKRGSKSRASLSGGKPMQEGLEIDAELEAKSKNLNATLHKLFLLEKKLLADVKAEEKLRVSHEKNCKRLKRLDMNGAEVQKVDSARTLIRNLSLKMRMAIHVVDKISIEINKIRDEELLPHLLELIQRQTKMWKNMLECHHNQREAIEEAVNLGSLGKSVDASEAYMEAVQELVKWTSAFSEWMRAQKEYVKALNNWLEKCIFYEPEETADGVVPFSPGRMGAPAVFVVCHQWAQAMDRISEKQVLEAMCTFTVGVLRLHDRKDAESLERVVTTKDLERKARDSSRDDIKVSREIVGLEKQIDKVANDGNVVLPSQDTGARNLHLTMLRLFETMETFMSHSLSVHEDLLQRTHQLP